MLLFSSSKNTYWHEILHGRMNTVYLYLVFTRWHIIYPPLSTGASSHVPFQRLRGSGHVQVVGGGGPGRAEHQGRPAQSGAAHRRGAAAGGRWWVTSRVLYISPEHDIRLKTLTYMHTIKHGEKKIKIIDYRSITLFNYYYYILILYIIIIEV